MTRATTAEQAMSKAFADMAREEPKRRIEEAKRKAYVESTPMIVVQERDAWGSRRIFFRRSRLGELSFEPAHTRTFSRLGDPTQRTEEVPDQVHVDSRVFSVETAPNYIRKISAADARKLRTIDERIAELQRRRKTLIDESFARGATFTPDALKRAGEKNAAVRKSGYRGFGPKAR